MEKGYKWLPRSQKPKYSKEDREARIAFADEVLAMSSKDLDRELTMCMDGVVLTLPPRTKVDRENYCKAGVTHCWRMRCEGEKPELLGGDSYAKQVPYERQVPMWGGIGRAGFGLVMFHRNRKVNQGEWSEAVNSGKLKAACQDASGRSRGPWCLLCDNEGFLDAGESRAAHAKARVELWHIPPRAPDLNPVGLYWAKVRA